MRLRPNAQQLGRLQELTDAALGHLELEQLLGALLERTRTLLDVDTCAILLLDRERNELVARAAVGIEEEVDRGVRIPRGNRDRTRPGLRGRARGAHDPRARSGRYRHRARPPRARRAARRVAPSNP